MLPKSYYNIKSRIKKNQSKSNYQEGDQIVEKEVN